MLVSKYEDERWLVVKMADSLSRQFKKILGPGHLVRKAILLGILGLLIFSTVYTVDYRVTAPTALEGKIQRVVAAPFRGYIKQATVRHGDLVRKGDRMCLLDDRDLKLERVRWVTEQQQYAKEYQAALARHDRAKIRILRAKIDQANAQIALIDKQLSRTNVVAPFDGVVTSGDLSQSLGAPVDRGEVLFEVAPLADYRVIAKVDERDIDRIREGQESLLMLPSMPGEVFKFTVELITPVSVAREGRNYFRVEGRLETSTDRMRPGMEGIGKIKVDRRPLIWVWTHEIVDWGRLLIWRWRP